MIPTRDRPAYVKNALESVLNQSFDDFEVVVCDNYKNISCKAEVKAFADKRVRYITPPSSLAMHDNWEFAIDQAWGDFVLVLIDKTLLRLNALERLQAATQSHPAEIYSWTSDAYYLTHEQEGDVGRGFLVPVRGAGEPFYVDCKQEMAARVSFHQRLGTEGPAYAYGKICFGAYSRTLIERVKQRFGKVCPLISPDYTSKTVALLSTDKLVDLNNSYTVSLNTSISNGMLFSQNTAHARRFLTEGGFSAADFSDLPIPHVFCSVHNICAYDWRMIDQAVPGHDYKSQSLDLAALYVQTQLDLAAIQNWASEEERQAIAGHMQAFLHKAPLEIRERILTFRMQLADEANSKREEAVAARESAAKAHEDWLKNREDQVTFREKAVLDREEAIRSHEAVVHLIAAWLAPVVGLYRQLNRVRRAISASPESPEHSKATLTASTAADALETTPGLMVNGYPAFGSTLAALRYAESEFYRYPLPKPAPAGMF